MIVFKFSFLYTYNIWIVFCYKDLELFKVTVQSITIPLNYAIFITYVINVILYIHNLKFLTRFTIVIFFFVSFCAYDAVNCTLSFLAIYVSAYYFFL